MTAMFREDQVNSGVDSTIMMVPLPSAPEHGFNFIHLLNGAGYRLSTGHKDLHVTDFAPHLVQQFQMHKWPLLGSAMASAAARQTLSDDRLLLVSCGVTLGKFGKIFAKSNAKRSSTTAFEVVVLRQRRIKLAILPVQLPDGRFHSQKPFDTTTLCDALNRIWTPQANIHFELTSSDPVKLDLPTHSDPKEKHRPIGIDPGDFLTLFKDKRPSGVDFTIFLIYRIGHEYGTKRADVQGRTYSKDALAFVADSGRSMPDGERTIAHEAGHWLGAFDKNGKWIGFSDNLETRTTHLMTQGAAGLKISLTGDYGTLDRFNRSF